MFRLKESVMIIMSILESKNVATLIDNKLVVFWLNLLLEYFVKTHRDGSNKKKS
jgi:hypothetical protein